MPLYVPINSGCAFFRFIFFLFQNRDFDPLRFCLEYLRRDPTSMIISQIFLPRKCSKTLFKQQQASKQSKTRFFAFSKSDSPRSRLKYVAFPCRRTSRFFDIKTTHRRSRLKYVAFPCRRTSRFFDKKQQTDGRVSSISPFRVSGHPVFSTKNNTPTVASALASRVSRLFVSVDISNTLHLFIKNKSFFI